MALSVATIRERTYKPADAWWTVFVVDPIAARVLWLITRLRPTLSPMTVTTGSLLLGAAAGVLFAAGRLVAGAIVYQLCFLLDCVDGKLARLQGRASRLGAFYDAQTNHVVYIVSLIGLAVHLERDDGHWAALGAIALVGLRVLQVQANRYDVRPGKNWAPFVASRGSWMARHRLLPPFSFPDKHAVLFLAGPVTGFVLEGIVVNLVLELALLARKTRRIVRTAPTVTDEVPPDDD